MRIPKRFKLFDQTIEVVVDEKLAIEDVYGQARYRQQKILLRPSIKGWHRNQSDIERTFTHELIHFILDEMQEDKLNRNEKFVDLFSSLLHQALNTMEYE